MSQKSIRARQVAELIQHHLGRYLHKEVRDPRLANVAITSVDVSPDLRNAKVYYALLNPEELKDAQLALEKATGFMRRLLAKNTELRYTPQLHFIYDDTLRYAQYLTDLIDKAVEEDESSHARDSQESSESKK